MGSTGHSTTADALLHGRLPLEQPPEGSRVNIDAVLLAAFAAGCGIGCGPARFLLAADLGAGTGAVGLLLLHAGAAARLLAVEAEPALAEILRRNVAANAMERAADVLVHDLRLPFPDHLLGRFDLVVANPPYLAPTAGHVSREPLRAAARHEIRGGLPEFLAAAAALAAAEAPVAFVYRWRRRAHAMASFERSGFRVVRERRHLPHPMSTPATFCVEVIRADAGAAGGAAAHRVEELVVHGPGSGYSPAVLRFLDGDFRRPAGETDP